MYCGRFHGCTHCCTRCCRSVYLSSYMSKEVLHRHTSERYGSNAMGRQYGFLLHWQLVRNITILIIRWLNFRGCTKLPILSLSYYSISKQACSDYRFYIVVKGTKNPKTVSLIIEVKMTTNSNFVNVVPQVSLIWAKIAVGKVGFVTM